MRTTLMVTDRASIYTVSVRSKRIVLHTEVYKAYFRGHEVVRLGTHQSLPLIYLKPVGASSSQGTFSIVHRQYDGIIACQNFLRAHNYHHTDSQQYRAQWFDEVDSLVVDLSDPVS